MITLASVDLPEPLGPMSARISPLSTVRSRPLRIFFSPAETCRFRISSSAMVLQRKVSGCGAGLRPGARDGADLRDGGPLREVDELGERRPLQRADHAALHPRPQE